MDWGTFDQNEHALDFARDARARVLALTVAFDGDLDEDGWVALTADLMPEGDAEQRRRLTTTLIAFAGLCSRLAGLAFPDPEEWLIDQLENVRRYD